VSQLQACKLRRLGPTQPSAEQIHLGGIFNGDDNLGVSTTDGSKDFH